jgi:hypothetical protein
MKRKIVLLILSIIILLTIASGIFLPTILKNVTIRNSKEWIGRQVELEKLKINYFNGKLQLIDFTFYESDDSSVFVSFDTLILNTEPYRLLFDEFVIERLHLSGLHVNIILYDSAFNFDDLIAFHSTESSGNQQDSISSPPLQFELSNLELNGSFITIRDDAIKKEMEINNLDFFIPYIAWNQEDRSQAGLKFNFKNGGYFQSNINVNPTQGDFDAELILKDMDISGYTDFVRKYIDLGSFNGFTDLDLSISGNMNSLEESVASGNLKVREFDLTDHNDEPLIAIKEMNVIAREIDTSTRRIIIDSLELNQPYIYFVMFDSTNNMIESINRALPSQEVASEFETDSDTLGDASGPDLYYTINNVIINSGMIDFVDRRTGEPFTYHLSDLVMSVDNIESTSTWIDTYSQMVLNNRGKLVAELGVNPSDPMNLLLDYTITDFMLSDLNIYSRHYMGFPILYGDMYYKGHTEITNGSLTSENKLIIHNVELGNKSSGIYDLPLKFALFLLKDKDGVINLDIPVSGDLKNPKISVGKIVWNTFKNLIIKAAAAPVKLLSGLIGADPHDIESVEYDFLDTTFTEHKKKQMDLLLQLEQEKEELEIELIYFNDPHLEKQELSIATVGKMYEQSTNFDYIQNRDDFEQFVREKVGSDTLDLLNACALLSDKIVIDSLYNQLNQTRLGSLRNYLENKNDSTEILIIASDLKAPKNIGSKPRFEVKYGMKESHIGSE